MATRKTSAQETDQNALIGYQMAIGLWTHERALNWGRFNVMLVANSIIMTVLGLTFASGSYMFAGALILAVVGIVICAVWFVLTRRGFEVQSYYVKSAREIEEAYLPEGIRTVSQGEVFAKGEKVSIMLGGKAQSIQMSAIGSIVTAETGALVVIGVFGGIYVLLALLTALQMARGIF